MKIIYLGVALVVLSFVSQVSALECKRYFTRQQAWSKPMGYCWIWVPGNRAMNFTKDYCTRVMWGHLPAVDTADKAASIADFTKIVAGKYAKGEIEKNWELFFRNGNKGWDIWLSPVHSVGNVMIWNDTGTAVSYAMHEKGTPRFKSGTACTLFSAEKKTWRFTTCDINTRWPFVCEQGKPEEQKAKLAKEEEEEEEDEDEDEDDEDNGNCPSGFRPFEDRCFKIGPGKGSVYNFAVHFCEHHGGHTVRIHSQKEHKIVKNFLSDYLKKGAEGAFLDTVGWDENQMIWSSDHSDASYVKKALHMRTARPMRPIFITRPNLSGGVIRHCPRGNPHNCRRAAFCEAPPKNSEESHHYDDYY